MYYAPICCLTGKFSTLEDKNMKQHAKSMLGKALALLLALVMVAGMLPGAAISRASAAAPTGLSYAGGKTFSNDTDQLCMEEELSAAPLSFEATVMLPAGYTDRAGVIAGNWRNGNNYGEFDSSREYVNFEIAANGAPRLFWQESHGTGTWENKGAEYKLDLTFDEVNVATGEYVHLAVTYDPDTDTANCYVNGELKQTLTSGNITPTVPFGPLMVGGDYRNEASTVAKDCKNYATPHNAQYFKGTIANLSVWSSVLAAADVKTHYDALSADGSAVPVSGTGLMGSWDLTAPDANGDYADKSANGNDVYVFTEWYDGTFAEGDYTMLVMPDPQILMKWQTQSWYNYTQWIADNVDDLNVKAVISVGDMVNDNNSTQWTQSVKGVEMFEETGVPWIPMRGNHDPSAEFNTYFPYSKYSQESWFGGSYEEGKMDFVYWFVNVGEREYMFLYLGWAPTWEVLDWAEEVIKAFPEKNVILSTHAYMNWDNTLLETGDGGCVGNYSGLSGYPEGVDIWEQLGKYENVVLALGGHIGSTDLAVWTDENGGGKTVTSMLVDSQHLDYVAAGLIAVLTFHEDSDVVDVNWYSPVKDKFFRERNQFSITVPHVEGDGSAVDTAKLKMEILSAETLKEINYDPDSWAVFSSALTAAKTVLNDAGATQDQVDAALTALKNAKAALVERSGLYFSASSKNYAEFSACAKIPETVEMWVKIPEGYTTRNMIAGGYGYKSATASTEIFWALEMNSSGYLRWWEEANNLEMQKAIFDGTYSDKAIKLNTGEWMLISIVRDQENREVRAYINGELAGTTKYVAKNTTTGTSVFTKTTGKTTTDPTRLGRDWREFANQSALTFEGWIGEIRTWSDDRTAAEIKAGYENDLKSAALKSSDYLSEANLYGAWRLTAIPANSYHPHTFNNLAAGTDAVTDLSIKTVGFTSPRDTSALEALIAEAKALTGSEYTADSWTAVETALAAAEAAVANTSNTQADIVAALNALQTALDGLETAREGLTFSAADNEYAQFTGFTIIPETVSVWVKIPADSNKREMIIGSYGYGDTGNIIGWGLEVNASGYLRWWEEGLKDTEMKKAVFDGTTSDKAIDMRTGEWMYVTIVRDQENKEIRAYINGELAGTTKYVYTNGTTGTDVMAATSGLITNVAPRIGRDHRSGTPITLNGVVGEIRIWSDDRTAAEILADYENDLKSASQRSTAYLSDADLYGAWQLRELTGIEYHPYTFANLATGTAAAKDLGIRTDGFTSAPVTSDKTALKTAIDTAKGLKQSDYLDGWEDMLKALEEAEAVYASPVADQTTVDAAAKALNDAINALVLNDRPGLTFSATSKTYAQFSDKMTMPETIEVWVKIPKDYTARNMIVGGYGNSAYSSSKELYWSIEMNAGGTLRYWEEGVGQLELSKIKFDGTSGNDTELIMINTGEWILITIVRDQENAQVRAYINGELAGTSSKVTVSGKNVLVENQGKLTSTPLRLGRDWRDTKANTAPLIYEGQIGELRVWNRDLTADEIKANYDNDMKAPAKRSTAYLADEALYGCWQLRDLTDEERHTFTFPNMATGTGADTDLTIKTVGFTTVLDTAALEAAILEAQSLNSDEYTDESWADVAEALEKALETLRSETAGQALIDAAAKALNDALDALVDAAVFVSGLTFSAADKNYAQFTACTVIPESVDVWVKIPKGYTGREMIVGGYGMTGKGYSEIFWSIEMNASSGTLRWWEEGFTKVDGANSPREMASASFSGIKLNTGEWILISIVRDQEKGEIRAYINGELAGTTTSIKSKVGKENVFPYTTGKMTTDPPRLGRDWRETLGGSNVPLTYEGKIGELRIWTDDRTAEEIRACYQNDIKRDSEQTDTYLSDANLYGAWRLAEIPSYETHPYIYPNLATGTAAATDLGIRTVGFLTEEENQVADYSAQYGSATGITFPNELNQMRAEEKFTTPVRTVSALINVPAGNAGGVILGNERWAGAYSGGDWYINFEINSSGQPVLQLRNGNKSDCSSTTYTATSIDVRGKGWVLVTTVFDEECGLVRWYINGKRVETKQGISTTNKAPYQPMKIGGDYSYKLNSTTNLSQYNTKYFKGTIAYVSAWDTVRSGSEILAEAQALQADFTAVPTSGKGLLASWSFAGTGDVLNTVYSDKSSNGNDAIPYAEFVNDYDEQYLKDNNIATELPEAEEGSYSVILLPDIQNITRDHMGGMSEYLDDYMKWIADNVEKYNIVSYLSMGDLTQDDAKNNSSGEWNTFANAQPILDAAGIPGVPMRGNHDGSGFFAQFVDYDYYAKQSWFGGSFEEGYLDNCYWFFEAGGRTYLVFSLGWSTAGDAIATGNPNGRTEREIGSNPELLQWVNDTIDKYPNANVILTAHNGMNSNGTYTANGQKLYDSILSKHDNIVLASYGHIDEYTVIPRTDKRADGVEFPSLLVDGQGIDQYEGCHAFICLLTFHEGSDEVQLNWYSVREASLYRIEGQYSINIPHVKGVDLSGLQADMEAAAALIEDDYTAESWAALEEALKAAQEVVDNKLSVTQKEVDAAEKALEDAIAALKEDTGADKTELQKSYDKAAALTETDYTSDSWKAVKDAMDAAKAVLDDEEATQEEVDAAKKTLDDAIAALVKRGDKTELQKSYDEASALTEADYTTDSWKAVKDAMDATKAVLDDPDALQPAIDEAKKALDDAMAALVERGDKTGLQKAYDEASALTEADYTTDSWKAVKDAMDAAKAVLDDPDALQPAIDEAKKALDDAMAALVERGDKTGLQKAYDEASALTEADYTTDSWKAVKDAMDAAKAVLDDPDALQPAIDEAKKALDDAMAALVKRGDKTELQKAVDEAKRLIEADYTTDSWAALKAALEAAQTVLDNVDALQTEIDAAEKALEETMAALVLRSWNIIVADTVNGSISADRTEAVMGDIVTVTVSADYGYGLVALTVTTTGGSTVTLTAVDDSAYTFTMPHSEVTVTALFVHVHRWAPGWTFDGTYHWHECLNPGCTADNSQKDGYGHHEFDSPNDPQCDCGFFNPSLPDIKPTPSTGVCYLAYFSDLNAALWYHEAVDYVVGRGIMNGTGNGTTFSPYMYLNRAMMMTMLARMNGVDTTTGSTWYEVGVKWAVDNGISDGTDIGGAITREQMVTMLYRYAGSPVVIGSYSAAFSDVESVSDWAANAMNWAAAVGVIRGKGNGTLDPQGLATRAEVAQFFMNYANRH